MKTNVTRLLQAEGIAFQTHTFAVDAQDLSATRAAGLIGMDPQCVYKTLALRGEKNGVFICCVPADAEVDLRKAARAAGEKRAEMLPEKALLQATGYVRGGCSPIGMKRRHPVFLDERCLRHDAIAVSAGARGAMVSLSPRDLAAYLGATAADLIKA